MQRNSSCLSLQMVCDPLLKERVSWIVLYFYFTIICCYCFFHWCCCCCCCCLFFLETLIRSLTSFPVRALALQRGNGCRTWETWPKQRVSQCQDSHLQKGRRRSRWCSKASAQPFSYFVCFGFGLLLGFFYIVCSIYSHILCCNYITLNTTIVMSKRAPHTLTKIFLLRKKNHF